MDDAQGLLTRPRRVLRVAHLVSGYLPITQRWIHAQIQAAPDTEPIVLNCGPRMHESEFPVARHVALGDLSARACAGEADGWERHGASPTLVRYARRFKCDLVHAHFGPMGTVGVPLAAALGVPLVTSFYGYDVGMLRRQAAWRMAYKQLFRRGARFLAEGPVLADALASLGCRRDRIGLMPLPVTASDAAAGHASPPVVLMCSRLVEKKGVDDGLRAIAHLRDRATVPFQVIVAGEGPEYDRLLALRHDLGLDDIVRFIGSVAPAALPALVAEATILLQMSRTAADGDCEGGAPVILSDAAASGVPAVATRHCDIPYVVQDGETGLLVESRDADAAARALASLLDDPALRLRLGGRARARAAAQFSPAACGERLRQHYDDALAAYAASRSRPSGRRFGSPALEDLELSFRRRAGDAAGLMRLLVRQGYRPREAAIASSLMTLRERVASARNADDSRRLRSSVAKLLAACESMAQPRTGRTRRGRLTRLRGEAWRLAYAVASQAENGSPADRRWATQMFGRLGSLTALPADLRGGACFHLARLHLASGRTADALANVARCLTLIPTHEAAARLLDGQRKAA